MNEHKLKKRSLNINFQFGVIDNLISALFRKYCQNVDWLTSFICKTQPFHNCPLHEDIFQSLSDIHQTSRFWKG